MSVSSARVQQLIKGDDVTLTHQIVKDAALHAVKTIEPVLVEDGDSVKFFYPLQDGNDLVGFEGTPVGAYPTSKFTVEIAGTIPPVDTTPERGSKYFQSGEGLTVRAEITRQSGKRESYYLYREVDVIERGFPVQAQELTLP